MQSEWDETAVNHSSAQTSECLSCTYKYHHHHPDPCQVLGWLLHQQKSDEIEEVTDEMLDEILEEREHVAVLVCKPKLLISEYRSLSRI